MRQQRWFPIAVLGLGLFAVNVVARLVTRIGFADDETAQGRISIGMFAVLGVVLAAFTFFRAQRVPPATWLPDLAFASLVGLLLTILVGPFINGDTPFSNGAGSFFSQVWLYAGFAIVGTLLGYWIATALGRDYRSRSLKAYATAKLSKPRRVVRR
jgi:hypothetical protein